jgi:hypothetical protein
MQLQDSLLNASSYSIEVNFRNTANVDTANALMNETDESHHALYMWFQDAKEDHMKYIKLYLGAIVCT